MTQATDPASDPCHADGAAHDHALSVRRRFKATPEQVWRACTTPELLKQWWAPRPFETIHAEIDARPGGVFNTTMRGPDGAEFPGAGIVLAVVPNRKLMFTDALTPDWKPAGLPFMVGSLELTPGADGSTDYVATAWHWNEATLKQHEAMGFHDGWGTCADQLGELLKGL